MSYISRFQSVIQNKLALRPSSTTATAGQIALSASCGSFAITSVQLSYLQITNMSVTLTTTGRPVMVMLIPDTTGTSSFTFESSTSGGLSFMEFCFSNNGGTSLISRTEVEGVAGDNVYFLPMATIDFPAAGTYNYSAGVFLGISSGTAGILINNYHLVAYEL